MSTTTTTVPFSLRWLDKLLRSGSKAKRSAVASLVVVALLALLYLAYSLIFLGRVYPNVFVGTQQYSGLKLSAVEERLNTVVSSSLSQPLNLNYAGKTYSVSAKEANWSADTKGTAETIFKVGRQADWTQSLLEQVTAPFYSRHHYVQAEYDETYLKTTLSGIAESIDEPAVNASAEFEGDKLVITHAKSGETINQETLLGQILDRWSSGSTEPIELVRQKAEPSIVIDDEVALKTAAESLATKKITLVWEGGRKDLNKGDVNRLVDFTGVQQPGSLSGKKVLRASFTDNKTRSYLQELSAESIDQPAKDPKLGIKEGKLVILEGASEGRVVDIDVSAKTVLAVLNDPTATEASLTFKAQKPLITENNLDSLGIKEIVGLGETSFAGSPANRRANIANGVRLLQSTLVKPGDEFSTVKTLGAVDGTTGFLPELVIKENKTTPEFGGGLCQVSTTLFRAVLNAGLKVTERQNHSYRVSYYEPPVGLDATIYLPKPDFKFLNDTGNYLLVQGQVIGSKVIFELWGTKDGRVSSLTTPIVTNVLPPPPEVRTETDTLMVGEVKQTEKAHEGATAVVAYTVTRNGQVINKQTFKSVYKPWAAKFLVGTKQPESPPPVEPPPPQP
ncbi:MAG: VanW family protein [Candidatus Berkelbacteria bacterium]|nr:MAG: VanW family protein [Candidatus Berkelbacteria bacterium]QQG51661.1 MAG: VanW family protein [Candidatus Berkelbacteria bacterium]